MATSRLGQGAQDLARRRAVKTRPARVEAVDASTLSAPETPAAGKVPIAEIARHPLNPRGVVEGTGEEFDNLVQSIREMGVLEPLVVAARSVFEKAHPDLAGELPDGVQWVLIAGERRLRAAEAAELTKVPVTSGDHLMADGMDVEAMVVENVNREALTPLQEAQAYRMLIDGGATQRLIADRVGRAQSHISKRLRLLLLPDDAQEQIRTGELGIKDAEALAAVAASDLEKVWADAQQWGVSNAVRRNEARKDQAARERKAQKKAQQSAAEHNVQLLAEDALPSGFDWTEAELTDEADIEAARAAGTLAAVQPWAGTDAIRLVDTSWTPSPEQESANDRAEQRQERERQIERDRKAAATARREHLAVLAGSRRPMWEIAAELAATVIARADTEAARLASKLMPALGAADPATAAKPGDYDAWRAQIAAASTADRITAARLLGLARLDSLTHHPWRSRYDLDSVQYIERLEAETPYERTPYDQALWPSAEDLDDEDATDLLDDDTEDDDR